MRGGDLSNESAPALGVRFERLIKTDEGKLNKSIKAYLQVIARKIEVNIYIITTGDPRKAMAFLLKWAVPFNKVFEASSELEIPDIVRAHDLLSYIDVDRNILQNVNSRGSGKVKAQLWTSQEVS